MALIDFTLSNAWRFYSSMGNPLGWKGLKILEWLKSMKDNCGQWYILFRDYRKRSRSLRQVETKILWFTSPSDNNQEEVGWLKPKSACPKRFKKRNKTTCSIKCALCFAQSRNWDIHPNGPSYKAFHGCYLQICWTVICRNLHLTQMDNLI